MKLPHEIKMILSFGWNLTPILFCLSLSVAARGEPSVKKFDENAVAWQDNRVLRIEGLRKAQQFHEGLLVQREMNATTASLIGASLEEFRLRYRSPFPDRPTLEQFVVTQSDFERQLKGAMPISPRAAFQPFSGRWYGQWAALAVDHHWHEVVLINAQHEAGRAKPGDGLPRLVAQQFAWIGDGFGWNFVIRIDEQGEAVLGYVYHVVPGASEEIRFSFPLVGYFDGPGRLIWVTPSSVYFEEVRATLGEDEQYAITGFNYAIKEGVLTAEDRAFQAVYTRNSNQRPPWRQFPVRLSVESIHD